MYLAELHGKLSRENENKEDILTSNVFSFFKYANRKVFLFELMKILELNVSQLDLETAQFQFWPTFVDGTEPDLVLIIGKYYLLFEAKYHSGFELESRNKKHQIVREIEGGKYEAENLEKIFKIVALTAHYSENSEIKKGIPDQYLMNVIWKNWQKIAVMLYQQIEGNPLLTTEEKLFASDLYELLVRKKLRNFEGVKVLSALPKTLRQTSETLFFNASTARYRGTFLGFCNSLLNESLKPLERITLFWKIPISN